MTSQDADNLSEHVKILATTDGRAMSTPGHERARKYLCAVLKHAGFEFYAGDSFELFHDTGAETIVNIIAVAPGTNREEPPLLVGAHYDTFGSLPGADDNAAADAIVLEIGKKLLQSPAKCDVILALFDSEEWGYLSRSSMGSTIFYKNQCKRSVRAGLIMDLVGHDLPFTGFENIMFVKGMESSSTWFSILKETEPDSDLVWATFLNSYVGSLSDHYMYAENGDPYLFFTCGRWEHYHQATDTPEKLSYSKMAVFADALLRIVRAAAENETVRGPYDSANDELFFLCKNVIPKLGMSVESFKTRKDIDDLVSSMLKRFSL